MTDISREELEEIRAIVDPNYFDVPVRKRLYERGFRELPHLPELAMQWFMEIGMEVSPLERELWFAKRRPEDEHLEGLPPWVYYEDSLEAPPLDEIHRVRVDDTQMLMWRDRERAPEGYYPMTVRDEFFRVDMAVLAVLVTMEADRIKPKEDYEYEGTEPELDFPKATLRYYRGAWFDGLPPKDQKDLAIRVYRRMYDVLESLRLLTTLLEYGEPGKNLTTHPMEEARSYVRAAELRHVHGLKNYEVAEALGLPKPKDYDAKVSYDRDKYGRKARDRIQKGEKILIEALGEEGFQKHVAECKSEKERWKTLGPEDRLVERLTDLKEDFAPVIRTSYREPLKEAFSRLLAGDRSVLEELRGNYPPRTYHPPRPPGE